jgi:hypothetical protein
MAYEARILEAKQYPRHVMSIVIDGSDNGEYGLPHFARKVRLHYCFFFFTKDHRRFSFSVIVMRTNDWCTAVL